MNQIFLAFLTGLTNGGISCSTTQGGLLASAVSETKSKFKATASFLTSKIIIHTILGFIFGMIGARFIFSLKVQGILQIFVGLFMIATSLKLMGINFFDNLTSFEAPTVVTKFLKDIYQKYPHLRQIILGASTVLVPCGATQAMYILAIGSGNPINGALIMFAFVLGTSPLFFVIGLTVGGMFKSNILKSLAIIIILVLGINSINNGQVLRNSPHTMQNYLYVLSGKDYLSGDTAKNINGIQIVEMTANNNGYKTGVKRLKAGIPTRINITSKNLVSCASNFVIPALNINVPLPQNGTKTIDFIPTSEGVLTFSCGMGMYTGTFEVVR